MAKKKVKKDGKDIEVWYKDQLAEKDKIIAQLKIENAVLLATALKQGAKTKDIFEKTKSLMKKKKPKF